MKRLLLILCACACAGVASAKALTPSMIRMNGLTDAQIDDILGRNTNATLRLTAAHWRNIRYRLHRYDNMRAWLNEQRAGRLGDRILGLTETNETLTASNATLRASCVRLAGDFGLAFVAYTNQLAQTASLSNLYAVASARAAAASKKIEEEIADLQSKVTKYETYKTKYPLLKSVWTSLINDAQNRIAILQALTNKENE